MGNRKLFLRYPPEYAEDKKVLNLRVEALEDFIEDNHSNSTSSSSWTPTVALILVNLLGVLGLLSPEKVTSFSKLLGH